MRNPAERRSGLRRDGPPLQKVFACALSLRHAPGVLHTVASPAENRAHRPRSSPVGALARPGISCGTPWHPAASWDEVWLGPRAAVRCGRWPAPARSKPAALLAATAPGDRGTASPEPPVRAG